MFKLSNIISRLERRKSRDLVDEKVDNTVPNADVQIEPTYLAKSARYRCDKIVNIKDDIDSHDFSRVSDQSTVSQHYEDEEDFCRLVRRDAYKGKRRLSSSRSNSSNNKILHRSELESNISLLKSVDSTVTTNTDHIQNLQVPVSTEQSGQTSTKLYSPSISSSRSDMSISDTNKTLVSLSQSIGLLSRSRYMAEPGSNVPISSSVTSASPTHTIPAASPFRCTSVTVSEDTWAPQPVAALCSTRYMRRRELGSVDSLTSPQVSHSVPAPISRNFLSSNSSQSQVFTTPDFRLNSVLSHSHSIKSPSIYTDNSMSHVSSGTSYSDSVTNDIIDPTHDHRATRVKLSSVFSPDMSTYNYLRCNSLVSSRSSDSGIDFEPAAKGPITCCSQDSLSYMPNSICTTASARLPYVRCPSSEMTLETKSDSAADAAKRASCTESLNSYDEYIIGEETVSGAGTSEIAGSHEDGLFSLLEYSPSSPYEVRSKTPSITITSSCSDKKDRANQMSRMKSTDLHKSTDSLICWDVGCSNLKSPISSKPMSMSRSKLCTSMDALNINTKYAHMPRLKLKPRKSNRNSPTPTATHSDVVVKSHSLAPITPASLTAALCKTASVTSNDPLSPLMINRKLNLMRSAKLDECTLSTRAVTAVGLPSVSTRQPACVTSTCSLLSVRPITLCTASDTSTARLSCPPHKVSTECLKVTTPCSADHCHRQLPSSTSYECRRSLSFDGEHCAVASVAETKLMSAVSVPEYSDSMSDALPLSHTSSLSIDDPSTHISPALHSRNDLHGALTVNHLTTPPVLNDLIEFSPSTSHQTSAAAASSVRPTPRDTGVALSPAGASLFGTPRLFSLPPVHASSPHQLSESLNGSDVSSTSVASDEAVIGTSADGSSRVYQNQILMLQEQILKVKQQQALLIEQSNEEKTRSDEVNAQLKHFIDVCHEVVECKFASMRMSLSSRERVQAETHQRLTDFFRDLDESHFDLVNTEKMYIDLYRKYMKGWHHNCESRDELSVAVEELERFSGLLAAESERYQALILNTDRKIGQLQIELEKCESDAQTSERHLTAKAQLKEQEISMLEQENADLSAKIKELLEKFERSKP